ncbi:pyridoxal phosphate-dependent transferase [Nitzschia inconspicua]|uniref:Pyridoxal phosphate-dependent transferase n=1 Tax=Nitzschia inconspicua TaxID=303405 RepID=A0A9K3PXF4_9STRA|nr:pyridoxal phosphate-dependent transferase [Nitzschia inconspicua]
MPGKDDKQYVHSVALVSAFLFGASSLWRIRQISQERERKARSGQANPLTVGYVSEGSVSRRCMRALAPSTPYLMSFLRGLEYPCEPTIRPEGFIALCVAENKLVMDVLSDRLQHSSATQAAFSDPTVYCYNSFLGLPVARQAAAYFLARRFLLTEQQHEVTLDQALRRIRPDHIGICAGAGAALNSLFYLLGDEGDACLIPAPYYAAFESDMSVVSGIIPFAVHMANPTTGPSESELDLAYMEAKSQGLNPRFLLITNPNNPLGIIYKRDVLEKAVTWARKRKILDNKLDDDVHFVWSISKDFGASGLRVGVVYSQNEIFLVGLSNLNVFSGVSHPIQMVVSELLTDDDFVDLYLDESRARLKQSYLICIEKLEEMVLPFVPVEAGQFVYVDFSSLLPEKTMAWEQRLSQLLIDYGRVILTPGESQRERMPGMFRLCYAWVTPDVLKIGMERLSRIVGKIRRMDWSDLNESSLAGVLAVGFDR